MSRLLFLLEDYNFFYTRESKTLLKENKNYQETLQALINRKHYQSDSMANAFTALGHDTKIVIPEANPLQLQWAKENNKSLYFKWLFQKPLRSYKSRVKKEYRTSYNSIQFEVMLAQVKEYKPDVIYFYSNIFITKQQLQALKNYTKKLVLQWSTPIWKEFPQFPYQDFDLIVTAAPQLKEYFSTKNCNCIYLQQAFDSSILSSCELKKEPSGDVIFIGGFVLGHQYRFEILEHLLKNKINLTIHGIGEESLPNDSLVYQNIHKPLYGVEMYNEYQKYKMAIHIHTTGYNDDGIDWSRYAGAKRLFEITGSGVLLLTSHQDNIKDFFEIDKEVVTFKSAEELTEKIKYYIANPSLANEIAKKGMERTLNFHSFTHRANELSKHLFN